MSDALAADVAHVLAALLEAKAWFRHGLTDEQLSRRTGLSSGRVLTARRAAAAQGFVERRGAAEHSVTMLTPMGVAQARKDRPAASE